MERDEHRHIDRAEQLRSARSVTERDPRADGERQAMFFEGPEYIGKSSLLFEIYQRHRADGAYYVDLADIPEEEGVLELLATLAQWQGVEAPSYRTARDRFAEQSRSTQADFRNVWARHTTIQLLSESKDRARETASLSDALLDNLIEGARRPVICLDSFDVCAQPMRNWLGRSLLPALLSRRQVSVFVAGRQLPRLPRAFTADAVHTLVLPPFDVTAVQEWIEELGLAYLRDQAVAIHRRHGGVPGLLDEFFRQHIEKRGPARDDQDSRDG
ncbi:hypothetical protein ACIRPU_41555 [Streptomyces sp. NPDC102259]|uniref:hypothetical protein n=1 Tax=Streptomyces sp. NPDC102259 TaxID=3366148 RepID=UPI00380B64CE